MNIVFMGTAAFAVPTLVRLFERSYEITGVITQPDKPAGRGQAIQTSPVKKKALELQLAVYQPAVLKSDEARSLIQTLAPAMITVVAYGKILPPWLLRVPEHGCINLHGSLLPKYRGAAPVHWAIANGEERTGVCTMLMDEGLDTGPVLLCEQTAIAPDETVWEVYDRLAELGSGLMEQTVEGILKRAIHPKPQDHTQATLAPTLRKEDGFIDWSMPAGSIHNRVRAFNPWPGTVTKFRGKVYKILGSHVQQISAVSGTAGHLVVSRRRLGVVCGGGSLLEIRTIQAENRKPVSGLDFANGARIQPGEKFEPMTDNGV